MTTNCSLYAVSMTTNYHFVQTSDIFYFLRKNIVKVNLILVFNLQYCLLFAPQSSSEAKNMPLTQFWLGTYAILGVLLIYFGAVLTKFNGGPQF